MQGKVEIRLRRIGFHCFCCFLFYLCTLRRDAKYIRFWKRLSWIVMRPDYTARRLEVSSKSCFPPVYQMCANLKTSTHCSSAGEALSPDATKRWKKWYFTLEWDTWKSLKIFLCNLLRESLAEKQEGPVDFFFFFFFLNVLYMQVLYRDKMKTCSQDLTTSK